MFKRLIDKESLAAFFLKDGKNLTVLFFAFFLNRKDCSLLIFEEKV